MAIFSALRRFAKLGFWIGLSAGAMLVDACSSSHKTLDAAPDGKTEHAPGSQLKLDAKLPADAAAPSVDGGALDADHAAADADQTDLWDIICE